MSIFPEWLLPRLEVFNALMAVRRHAPRIISTDTQSPPKLRVRIGAQTFDSIADAAAAHGVTEVAVYNWVARGKAQRVA